MGLDYGSKTVGVAVSDPYIRFNPPQVDFLIEQLTTHEANENRCNRWYR